MSEGECPLEEWVGLDTFLFCGAAGLSADPGGSGTGRRETIRSSHDRERLVLFTAAKSNTMHKLEGSVTTVYVAIPRKKKSFLYHTNPIFPQP